MKMVNVADAKAQLSDLLDAAAAGERVVICKRNQPIAEIRPVVATRSAERPLGLAEGAVTVTPAFFEPLPETFVESFERPACARDPVLSATRVAEPRRTSYEGAARLPAARAPRRKR